MNNKQPTIAATIAVLFSALLSSAPVATHAGELDSVDLEQATLIECGNLTFGGNKTSVCFADAFLKKMEGATNLKVATKYRTVRLDSPELFEVPFCILSGEGSFRFSETERKNLRDYVHRGGFILSSPGCSDSAFDSSLRKEIAAIFTEQKLEKIPMDHLIFRTVKPITRLTTKRGSQTLVEGLTIDGRLALIYSLDGLNDARNAKGCCCCGGNEIKEAADVNINILAYALLY